MLAVLGAGVSGLAVGMVSGAPVYEATDGPGGLCSSYYVRPDGSEKLHRPPADGEAYRFERGGGHWIFGGDPGVLAQLDALAPFDRHERRAAVDLGDGRTLVPYPVQAHLDVLDPALARRAGAELARCSDNSPEHARTMKDWLLASFGPALCHAFFFPFHERYTAGLYDEIAPQDAGKSPSAGGALGARSGYNATFAYPRLGLDALVQSMADLCDVRYSHRVVSIDPGAREIAFEDGSSAGYTDMVSTLPLVDMVRLAGLSIDAEPDPHTSVLVLNIGAERGPRHPDAHWIYQPRSASGHHRVGCYSNVDASFLPHAARPGRDRTAIYVGPAYRGHQPTSAQQDAFASDAVAELQHSGWLGAVDVVDATWIEVAYTWMRPGSMWRTFALETLGALGIRQVGRFARWSFQGIADSVRDGFVAGSTRPPT